jgi:hypothetical protein
MVYVNLHQTTLLGSHKIYIEGKMYKQSVNCITDLMMKHLYINLTARELEDNRLDVWRFFWLIDWLGCSVVVGGVGDGSSNDSSTVVSSNNNNNSNNSNNGETFSSFPSNSILAYFQ